MWTPATSGAKVKKMAFDFKKEFKEFYLPRAKPEIVNVSKANYIAVRGKGNPNEEGGTYQQAVGILYAVAYTLKMSYKQITKLMDFLNMLFHHLKDSGGKMELMELIIQINLHLIGFQ